MSVWEAELGWKFFWMEFVRRFCCCNFFAEKNCFGFSLENNVLDLKLFWYFPGVGGWLAGIIRITQFYLQLQMPTLSELGNCKSWLQVEICKYLIRCNNVKYLRTSFVKLSRLSTVWTRMNILAEKILTRIILRYQLKHYLSKLTSMEPLRKDWHSKVILGSVLDTLPKVRVPLFFFQSSPPSP